MGKYIPKYSTNLTMNKNTYIPPFSLEIGLETTGKDDLTGKEKVPVAKRYYLGANSDGSGILSTRPLRRFYKEDSRVCSVQDTRMVPHWCGAYEKGEIKGNYHIPIGEYLFIPKKWYLCWQVKN